MDVPRRGEVGDASHLAEGVGVDGENDMRIVHRDPSHAVVQGHRLRHVAQLEGVGPVENFVFDGFRFRVVIRQRGVSVLEHALVDDEQPPFRRREILRAAVVPLHAAAEGGEA